MLRLRVPGVASALAAWCATLLASAPGWALTQCPRSVTFTSDPEASVLDVGWTGRGHGLALGSWALKFAVGSCTDPAPGCR